jgi:predicted GTPase
MAQNTKSLVDKIYRQVQERAQKQVKRIEVQLMTQALAQLVAKDMAPADEVYSLASKYGVKDTSVYNKVKELRRQQYHASRPQRGNNC